MICPRYSDNLTNPLHRKTRYGRRTLVRARDLLSEESESEQNEDERRSFSLASYNLQSRREKRAEIFVGPACKRSWASAPNACRIRMHTIYGGR